MQTESPYCSCLQTPQWDPRDHVPSTLSPVRYSRPVARFGGRYSPAHDTTTGGVRRRDLTIRSEQLILLEARFGGRYSSARAHDTATASRVGCEQLIVEVGDTVWREIFSRSGYRPSRCEGREGFVTRR
ncbi:hypothetical protein J6590_067923, partial [Homalodisca vitripennis]